MSLFKARGRQQVRGLFGEDEEGSIRGQRLTETEYVVAGQRRVVIYAAGHEVSIWVPGTDPDDVNETLKVWLTRGDDDQDPDDDLSTRYANFAVEGRVLFTFRRSWVSGYHIPLMRHEEMK